MPQKLVVRVMPPNQYPHALHEALGGGAGKAWGVGADY
jgi:hypothetical protein